MPHASWGCRSLATTRPGGFDLHWWLNFLPASLILLAVGLVDDIHGLGAWKKLAGQIVAALWIALSGTHFGSLLGYQLPPFLDGLLVVVWIVAVINAYNLIDGLDGLASGLAIISATGLCGILVLGNLPGVYFAARRSDRARVWRSCVTISIRRPFFWATPAACPSG